MKAAFPQQMNCFENYIWNSLPEQGAEVYPKWKDALLAESHSKN